MNSSSIALETQHESLLQRCVQNSPHVELSEDQLSGLRIVCSGKDGLILIRTGGGKGLIWQLPLKVEDGDGLTLVIVPTRALSYDLKESTDRVLDGSGRWCCLDERSDGGDAVASVAPAPTESEAAADAAAARIGMAWTQHRSVWRCETECPGCAPPAGKRRALKCSYKCGACSNCTGKGKYKCKVRQEREAAWAATVGGASTPQTAALGGRTSSRLEKGADADAPVTEAEVREEKRRGTAAHAMLCEPRVRVIITTPEALCGESRESRRLWLACRRCRRLTRIVHEEAHCAHRDTSFRPLYAALGGRVRVLKQQAEDAGAWLQVLGFSATVPPPQRPLLLERLGMDEAASTFVGELDRPEITFTTYPLSVRPRQSFRSLLLEMWDVFEQLEPGWASQGRVLFYFTTAIQAQVAAQYLRDDAGVTAGAYCSRGMTKEEREASLAGWDARAFRVMTATKAFGEGIDRPDVDYVLHGGLPQDVESWWQACGRAGRGKQRALTLTFIHPRFVNDRLRLTAVGDGNGEQLPALVRLLRLLTAERCLRKAALDYLGGRRGTCPVSCCCCRCQRVANGDSIGEPIFLMAPVEAAPATMAVVRDLRTRIAESETKGHCVLLSHLFVSPPTALTASPWEDMTWHAVLVMGLIGIGVLTPSHIATDSGWAHAFTVVGINSVAAEEFEAGERRLALALPCAAEERPPPSLQRAAEAEQALLTEFHRAEAIQSGLPRLYAELCDAGGDTSRLPPRLFAMLADATADWLLPQAEPPQLAPPPLPSVEPLRLPSDLVESRISVEPLRLPSDLVESPSPQPRWRSVSALLRSRGRVFRRANRSRDTHSPAASPVAWSEVWAERIPVPERDRVSVRRGPLDWSG